MSMVDSCWNVARGLARGDLHKNELYLQWRKQMYNRGGRDLRIGQDFEREKIMVKMGSVLGENKLLQFLLLNTTSSFATTRPSNNCVI